MMELKAARAAYTPFSVAELPFRSVTPFQPFGRRLAEEEEGEEAHGSELEACRSCYLLAPSTAVAAAGAQLHQEGLTESEVYAYCSGGDAATASTKIVWSSGGRVINTWEVGGAAAAISSFSSPSSARQHQPSRTLSWASFPSSLASSGLPDSFSFSSSSSSSFNSIGSTWWKEAVCGGALRQQRRRRYLCVLQAVARTLTLCETNEGMESTSGSSDKVQHIPLPFLASSLWRLPLGLLVQRAVSSSSSFSHSKFPAAEQITAEAVPGLFSLLHPLEELRPVPTTTSPSSSDVGTILYSSERWPLIVSHHQQRRQNHQSPTECEMDGHSLWILLPAQQSHQPPYTTAVSSKKAERDFGPSNSSADPVLEPQLALHRLFVEGQGEGGKEPKGKASSVFIMPDEGQSDENHLKGLLCLLIPTLSHHLRGGHQSTKAEEGASSILEVYSFSITLSPSSSLPSSKYSSSIPSAVAVPQCLVKKVHSQAALAAVPIERRASNSSSDLVVLHTNGSIGVYRQLKLLFHCSYCVPSPLSLPAPVVGLCDAIGSRLNLLLGDRNQTRLRVTVPEVASSPLVLRCLAFLCSAMHQEDTFTLLRLYLCQQHNNVASSLPAETTDGEEEVEWRSLCHVLHFIFERQATEPYHSPAPQQLSSSVGSDHNDDDGDDDWQYLLGSNVHQRYSTSFSALDKHCTIPNATRSPSSSFPPSTSSYSLLEEEWNSKVVLFSTSCSTILFALHSVYEESKLNILHSSYVQRLGTLLMELAQRLAWLNYLEHYRRDLGLNVVDGAACTSPLASCEEEPPSIYSWLHRRLRGEIGLKPFTFAIQPYEQGESTTVPLVDASRGGDTLLTRKVCLFYDILCGGDGHHYANAHPNNRGKGETKEEKEKLKEESTAPASKPVVSYNKPSERWQRVVLSMAHEGFTLEQLNNLPFGVAVPLRDAIQQCRAGNIPTGWPAAAYHLLGRNDLAPGCNASLVEQLPSPHDAQGCSSNYTTLESTGISFATRRNRPITTATGSAAPTTSGEQDIMGKKSEWDGLGAILDNEACRLRFGRDQRLRDVHKMLAPSYPRRIHLQANQAAGGMGMAEHEIAAAQQKQLLRMAHRTLALAVGRGMFTLSSTSSHLLVEPLPIPLIVLDGKAGERGKTLTVTLEAGSVPPEVLRWPEFHNGVATALRIAPSYQVADLDDDELASSAGAGFWDQRQVTSTWIVYNKQLQAAAGGGSDNNMSNGHAGLLMGLGLQGHLSSLSQTKVFDYLSKGHELTSVGILLGMAASKIGTMEASLAKLLSIHVPALHPPSSSDLEVPPSVQTASLLALGLLYQGTLHRHMCEILLQEIGRSPLAKPHPDHGGSSSGAEREGLALAAGLALGLVGLAQGGNGATMKPAGLSDMCIEDTLFYYMEGGRQGGNTKRPLSSATSSLDGGGVSALHDWLAPDADDTAAAEDSITMMITGNGASDRSLHGNSNNSKNNLVLLSSRRPVDVDVTAAGAILALALLFLKTEHRVVAQRLAPPTTPYLLDGIRPDLLLLRVLARNLVLWYSIQPNKGWMDSQMPQVVLRFTAKEDAKRTRGPIFAEEQDDDEDVTSSSNYAYADTLRQAHINILAGACLSLGLRFAGSSDGAAYALLLEQVEYMQKRLRVAPEQDYPMVETCLNMATLSLSLVMAGTGHLPTLRLLRSQHRRVRPRHPHNRPQRQEENLTDLFSRNGSREAVSYGTHMATNMALGLLFLGGGRYSLGTQNHQIAALVCALYPRFPLDCQDNRYHLQAFRHLYVLACEERCVQAVDVETRQQCYVPIRVDLMTSSARKGSSLDLTAPCLLPEFRFIHRISIVSPRYWSYNIVLAPSPDDDETSHSSVQAKTLLRHRIIFVKRKTGFLSYSQDPAGLRSILCRPFPQYQHHLQNPACHLFQQQKQRPPAMGAAWKQQNRLLFIKSFSQDPNILAFANHFALPQSCANPTGASTSPFTQLHNEEAANFLASFCTAALYECLTQEKPEVLQTYLHLYRIIQQLRNYSAICSSSSSSGHLAEREVAALTQSLLNVKIILAYYSSSASSSSFASDTYNDDLPATASSPAPLLQATMLAELQDSVNSFFDELHFCLPTSHAAALHPLSPSSQLPQAHNPTPLQQYILSFLMKDEATPISSSTTTQRLFGCFLQYYDIPYPPSLISNFAIPSSSSSARRGVSMLRLARLLPHSPPHVLATILLALRPKTPLQ